MGFRVDRKGVQAGRDGQRAQQARRLAGDQLEEGNRPAGTACQDVGPAVQIALIDPARTARWPIAIPRAVVDGEDPFPPATIWPRAGSNCSGWLAPSSGVLKVVPDALGLGVDDRDLRRIRDVLIDVMGLGVDRQVLGLVPGELDRRDQR